MKNLESGKAAKLLPLCACLLALGALVWWFVQSPGVPLKVRVPGTDNAPSSEFGTNGNAVLAGKVIRGDGQPSKLPAAWPQFRGPERDGLSKETGLARTWPGGAEGRLPSNRELWSVDAGEGYAGPAVFGGRVFLMDYDREKRQDALRCLSLDDGREIWRYGYPVVVKRNHGMSRTVPAVNEQIAVAMGPKCHVVCVNPETGELRWGLDLVRQFGATVPQWYAGQCPLIEGDKVILAPGGKNALLVAVDALTGNVRWQTPNPHEWKMTHSSVMPMNWSGRRMYVYCASKGVVGVSADDGSLLWESADWKISIATVPSPLVLDGGRIFLSGGYNAGSVMLQLSTNQNQIEAKTAFRLPPEVFGATQHTPVYLDGLIYGIRADGRFACITPEGKPVWASDLQFGLGPFLVADGLIYAMNDTGLLRLFEASTQKFTLLGQAQILNGHDSWAPMALAGGRLIARDLTRMVCLDVSGNAGARLSQSQ